jgi:hypothetical protein
MKTKIHGCAGRESAGGISFLLFCLVCLRSCFYASAVLAGPLDMGTTTSHTPYDSYFGPVWDVLHHLSGAQPDSAVVEQLIREGHAFRYSYNQAQPYVPQTPSETEATKAGDCKAKSLWLASKMNCRSVRFVVGKARLASAMSHAWLIWQSPSGWLILDATNYSRSLDPGRLSPNEFIALYSYSPSGKFAHSVSGAERGEKYGDHL